MSFPNVRKLIAAACGAVILAGSTAVASAAPKDYCGDLKGGNVANVCRIQMTDPGYTVDISFPSNYPDMKSVADFISKTRDSFLNAAKSSTSRDTPYALQITPTTYTSLVPPRGQLSVVLRVYQNTGGAHPQTAFKSFVWDQAYQNFAITNDGVIFFFSQGTLLAESAGATQVLVPRSVIDALLA